MGDFWEDRPSDELLLNYAGIEWGLREECHCLVRRYGKVSYVIPKVCVLPYFQRAVRPGMLAARKTIKRILKSRGVKIEIVPLELMTEEAMMIRELGWETYKTVARHGLEFAKRNMT